MLLFVRYTQSIWLGMGRVIGIELRSLWLQGVGENHGSNLPHLGMFLLARLLF
jgi:hypothetical protein